MNDNGSYQVTVDLLRQGAAEIEAAAQTDQQVALDVRSIDGQDDPAVFGISAQAQAAARDWALSLRSRADDATVLHDETHQLAEELQSAAAQYHGGDQQNAGVIGASGGGLHHPHLPRR